MNNALEEYSKIKFTKEEWDSINNTVYQYGETLRILREALRACGVKVRKEINEHE